LKDCLHVVAGTNRSPHLAERYDVDQGGGASFSTYGKVPFHNEQEFTAADAAASLKRWGVVTGRGRVIFGRVDKIEETDRYTVTVTFKEPTGLLPEFSPSARR
jgi:peptide/nickel transport system substrate-binding protein